VWSFGGRWGPYPVPYSTVDILLLEMQYWSSAVLCCAVLCCAVLCCAIWDSARLASGPLILTVLSWTGLYDAPHRTEGELIKIYLSGGWLFIGPVPRAPLPCLTRKASASASARATPTPTPTPTPTLTASTTTAPAKPALVRSGCGCGSGSGSGFGSAVQTHVSLFLCVILCSFFFFLCTS